MKKTIRVEQWKNQNGDREDHLFIDSDRQIYLFGYNPKYVSKEMARQILEIITKKK